MLDYFFTPEGGAMLCFGLTEEQVQETQDETYEKFGLDYGYYTSTDENGNTVYNRNDMSLVDNNLASAVAGKRMTIGIYGEGFVDALNRSYTTYARQAMSEWDYYKNTAWPDKALDAQFTTDESATYNKVFANIDTYLASNLPKFITGSLDLNGKDWDDFCTMLNKYGPGKVTTIYQRLFEQ